jgi:hypothetical protein
MTIPSPINFGRRIGRAARQLWRAKHVVFTVRIWIFTLREIPVMAFAWIMIDTEDGPL